MTPQNLSIADLKAVKKRPWNYGKRKPSTDEYGQKWCNCHYPKLISSIGVGQAFCLLCFAPWYH